MAAAVWMACRCGRCDADAVGRRATLWGDCAWRIKANPWRPVLRSPPSAMGFARPGMRTLRSERSRQRFRDRVALFTRPRCTRGPWCGAGAARLEIQINLGYDRSASWLRDMSSARIEIESQPSLLPQSTAKNEGIEANEYVANDGTRFARSPPRTSGAWRADRQPGTALGDVFACSGAHVTGRYGGRIRH